MFLAQDKKAQMSEFYRFLLFLQDNDCGAPAAGRQVGIFEAGHRRMLFQDAVNDGFEGASSFAMNNTQVINSALEAFFYVFINQLFDFLRTENVEV
jgi:hypothetical protein